jgi:hypothetical protein
VVWPRLQAPLVESVGGWLLTTGLKSSASKPGGSSSSLLTPVMSSQAAHTLY